jgi:hypothetical protein
VAEVNRIMTDYFHARDALEAVSRKDLVSGCVMALSLFSTCGPKTSLRSDIFPAPSTSRLESWNIAWLNFRRTAKSSPIAVALIVFCRLRLSRRSACEAISSIDLRMVIPNGRQRVCRSKPWPKYPFSGDLVQHARTQQTAP